MASMGYQSSFYHREVAFCKVYGIKNKDVVESILLKNRISYFIDIQKESILRSIFAANKRIDKRTFIVKINEADVEKASELLQGLEQMQITPIERQ